MTQPNWSVERSELERVAQDLRDKGYEVVVEPAASELPDFVREYQPDIIARSSKECLVVEVSQLLSNADRERVRAIARRVESRPGWRFVLVTPEPRRNAPTDEGVTPMEAQQVRDWLSEANTLVQSGHSRSALVVAWAALEAAMRLAAQAHALRSETSDSWALMRDLVSNGVLSRDLYQQLTDLFRLRSAFAHGMQPVNIPAGLDLDKAVEAMSSLATELLSESARGDPPPA